MINLLSKYLYIILYSINLIYTSPNYELIMDKILTAHHKLTNFSLKSHILSEFGISNLTFVLLKIHNLCIIYYFKVKKDFINVQSYKLYFIYQNILDFFKKVGKIIISTRSFWVLIIINTLYSLRRNITWISNHWQTELL